MPTATDSPPSPTRPPPCVGPDGQAPQAAVIHCLYYRKTRTEKWEEVFSSADPEQVWLWFLEFKENGHFRFVERPADLFDADEAAGR